VSGSLPTLRREAIDQRQPVEAFLESPREIVDPALAAQGPPRGARAIGELSFYLSMSGTIKRGRKSETLGQMISAASTNSIGTSMIIVSFSA
jgi:hypothetical protein